MNHDPNNDPQKRNLYDEMGAQTAQAPQQGAEPSPGADPGRWERLTAGLTNAADRSTGWVAARVKDTFQDFVGRVLYGETATPEPSDKFDHDKGIDR